MTEKVIRSAKDNRQLTGHTGKDFFFLSSRSVTPCLRIANV
ncbi:MAG: hypothetical protein RMK91_03745 [Pseudanabaenaceae cyanobacterium SKYGB_i_bin29]|nr:hypothetical protein [Pseudanabaenaceae cyanobacterium SKYG29]MDW8420955.1 hypothetical protein [Pseudanabaenaceae cyanobacterium SKYGB_i_bin29]